MQSNDKRISLLRDEAPARAIVRLGVPLIAGMFIMVLYNLVDTYFIGLMKDDYQLAAVNLAYPVMMISIAVSNMVGTGAAGDGACHDGGVGHAVISGHPQGGKASDLIWFSPSCHNFHSVFMQN